MGTLQSVVDAYETIEVAEFTESDEDAPPSELQAILEEAPTDGNMSIVRDRLKRLQTFMYAEGIWPERAVYAVLKKHYGKDHLSDLSRDELDTFTKQVFEHARGAADG
jgi:hypothetical protein